MAEPMTVEQATEALLQPGAPFERERVTIRGVEQWAYVNAPESLRALYVSTAHPADDEALIYQDERWTHGEVREVVAALATQLQRRFGVGKGDRVAIAMRNYPEWIPSFWAVVSIGAVAVPLNAWWTGDELEYGLTHSRATVLVCDDERVERLSDRLADLDLAVICAHAPADLPAGVERFEDVVDEARGEPLPDVEIHPDDDATLMYTSGTTGRPKGAVATHRADLMTLMNAGFYSARNALVAGSDPSQGALTTGVLLITFPFFHVAGLQSSIIPAMASGATMVLMYKWDPDEAAMLVERERVNAVTGVPTTLMSLLETPSARDRDLSSLGSFGAGGMAVPPELVRQLHGSFPAATLGNGYGLTETCSIATMNSGPEYVERPTSVGRPVPISEIKAIDVDGTEVPTGEIGEICIKGPNVFRAYFDDPQATDEAFLDGWFRSGDLGYIDADGYVYIVDRNKDVVIRGGENVYCAEVEAALVEHPAVFESAVIGVPDRRLGEEVGAVVRCSAGASTTVEELQEHVRSRLAGFKVPTRIWVRDEEMPKTATGKVLKRQLKEELL